MQLLFLPAYKNAVKGTGKKYFSRSMKNYRSSRKNHFSYYLLLRNKYKNFISSNEERLFYLAELRHRVSSGKEIKLSEMFLINRTTKTIETYKTNFGTGHKICHISLTGHSSPISYYSQTLYNFHIDLSRFPNHYMFELTQKDYESLRSQNATLKQGSHSTNLGYGVFFWLTLPMRPRIYIDTNENDNWKKIWHRKILSECEGEIGCQNGGYVIATTKRIFKTGERREDKNFAGLIHIFNR